MHSRAKTIKRKLILGIHKKARHLLFHDLPVFHSDDSKTVSLSFYPPSSCVSGGSGSWSPPGSSPGSHHSPLSLLPGHWSSHPENTAMHIRGIARKNGGLHWGCIKFMLFPYSLCFLTSFWVVFEPINPPTCPCCT